MRGIPLKEVVTEAQNFLHTLDRIGGQEQAGAISTVVQAIKNLRGETESSVSFSSAEFNENVFIKSLTDYGSRHFAHYYFINKMQCLYFQGQYLQAIKLSNRSAEYLKDSAGMLHSVEHHFYTALTLAMLYPQANSLQRYRSLKAMKWTEKKLKLWTQQCNENFVARRYLVSGEVLRLQGKQAKALACYENANQHAETHGQLHLQGLANEMLARLCDNMKLSKSASYYQNEAVSCYQHWGANAYQQRLAIEKGILSTATHNASVSETAGQTAIESHPSIDSLDVATLIKSAEVIAKQRRLPELLQTLISIVIENAGAQRGVLLLQESNNLVIQAEATFEANKLSVLQQIPLLDFQAIPHSIINYVSRTQESIALDNVMDSSIFSQDDDVISRQVLSVLCAPLMMLGELKGIIYLENNATEKAFSEDRLILLQHLSGQIVISIDNALIYQNLETKVLERTHDIET
ncbi:MAG: GAF domain-containing protein, partial [Methylococcales bacterium]|nr:GAF domain-containing protein [Methylococcales bacterium]